MRAASSTHTLRSLLGERAGTNVVDIFLNVCAGSTLALDVSPEDTITSLKRLIYEKEAISPDHQVLLFGGKQLQCSSRISDCSLQHGSTVVITLRLLAGKNPSLKNDTPHRQEQAMCGAGARV